MPFNSVRLYRDDDHWVVVVIENDNEVRNFFQIERHAESFADGQLIRLGLPPLGQHISNASLDDDAQSQ